MPPIIGWCISDFDTTGATNSNSTAIMAMQAVKRCCSWRGTLIAAAN